MISFQDNTVRDGMQQKNIPKDITTQKCVLKTLSQTAIDSFEIGMYTSIDETHLIESKIDLLRGNQSAVILTRMIKEDIDLVANLQKKYSNVVLKLLVPVSNLHIEVKLNTTKTVYLTRLDRILEYIKIKNLKFEVCLEDSTRADSKYLEKVLKVCNKYNFDYLTLADTVGCATPDEYGSLFKKIKKRYPRFNLSAHCHNDLGLATANSLSAILNGATRVETTFLGIGERAGNAAIDEIVILLNKKNKFDCHITSKDVYETSKEIAKIIDFKMSPLKPILGENIFVHESGIHQDGTLKDAEMYQFILPEDVGEVSVFDFPISGVSSRKIIEKYFEVALDDSDELSKKYAYMYKKIAMVIDNITPEEFIELYKLIGEKEEKVYGSAI